MKLKKVNRSFFNENLEGLPIPAYLAGFLEIAVNAFFGLDAQGKITFWNPGSERLYGWSASEALGKSFLKLFWPVSTPEVREMQRKWLKDLQRGETIRGEYDLRHKSGSLISGEYTARAIFDQQGKISGYVIIHRDITERIQADAEIRRLNAELQAQLDEINTLVEMLPIGIWAGNHDCSVVTGNPAAYRILGLPDGINASFTNPESEVPPGLRMFVEGAEVAPEDAPLQTVARTGKPLYNLEHEYILPDQTRKTVYANIVPVFDPQGEVRKVIGAYTDFTERKQAQARTWLLSQVTELIRQISDSDEFFYAVARLVGEHLLVRRSFFLEIDETNDRGLVRRDFVQGLPSVAGEYRLSDYSPETMNEMKAGRTVVNRDSQLDPRTAAYYEKTYKPNGERAYVAVPLLRDERFVGAFWVSVDIPRDWSPEEVALLETVAERAWLAVEKIRLDQVTRHDKELLQRIFDSIPVMITRYKPDTHVLQLNKAFERTTGWTADEARNMDLMTACYPDPAYRQEVRQFMESLDEAWKDILMTTRDGRVIQTTWANIRLSDGTQVGIGLDITQRKQSEELLMQARELAEQTADRIARLQKVTEALSGALTPMEVAEVLIRQGAPALGAVSGTLMVLSDDGQWLEIVQSATPEALVRPYRRFPVSMNVPAAEAARLGQPIWIESRQQYLERYPHIADQILAWNNQTAVAIPMGDKERLLGVLTLSFEQSVANTPENLGFAQNLARQGAQALERARLYQAEQRARQSAERAADRITRLQQITAALTGLGTAGELAEAVIQLSVAATGASAGLLVEFVEHSQELNMIAAYGYSQAAIQTEPVPLMEQTPVSDCVLTRQAIWIRSQDELADRYPSLAELRGESGNQATAAIPLTIGDRVLGGLAFSFTEKHDFDVEEREFLLAIAQECAEGLERARAGDALRESKNQLQSLNESLERRVREQTAEVRQLASDLIKVEQRERHRIAHILHEDLQQRIYAIQMQVEFLFVGYKSEHEVLQENIAKIKKQLNEVMALTRHLSVDLSPPILRDEGLTQAIEWLASQIREQHGLEVELEANGSFAIPDEDIHMLLFSSVRELLFNVVKHSGVNRALVSLKQTNGDLRVTVRDEGRGFDVATLAWGARNNENRDEMQFQSFSLPTLSHRLSLFGGNMEIRSAPGAGVLVTITIPLPEGMSDSAISNG